MTVTYGKQPSRGLVAPAGCAMAALAGGQWALGVGGRDLGCPG